jgi:hypothetical protein
MNAALKQLLTPLRGEFPYDLDQQIDAVYMAGTRLS